MLVGKNDEFDRWPQRNHAWRSDLAIGVSTLFLAARLLSPAGSTEPMTPQSKNPAGPGGLAGFVVGAARIELATPAMSMRECLWKCTLFFNKLVVREMSRAQYLPKSIINPFL